MSTGTRAIIYRDYLLLTRNRTNLLLAVVPTAIYLLMFATSLSALVGTVTYHGVAVSYPEFAIPAIILSSMLAASTTTGTSLFQEEVGGMAVELWSYPMSRLSYIVGKIIATTALVLVQSVAALLLGVLVFRLTWPAENWLALALGTLAASLLFNAFYLLVATFVHDFQRFMVLINVLGPLLLFSSPSFYPVEQMPAVLQVVTRFNPVTYGIEAIRGGAVFGLGANWPLVVGLLAAAAVLMAAIAAIMARRIRQL
ncbi:ABC transporter permease [Nonomuraea endophytica]|uniref:ABC transporter permease n=1 Tax=Nonomuraea endophytica TaxID=714136 RepID=UPI0037CA9A04